MIPIISEVATSILGLIGQIRKTGKIKDRIKALKEDVARTQGKIKTLREQARFAGMDLDLICQHTRQADAVYDGLKLIRDDLQKLSNNDSISLIQNSIVDLKADFLSDLLAIDISNLSGSPTKDSLVSSRNTIRELFRGMNSVKTRDELLPLVRQALEVCIEIAGFRVTYFTMLSRSLQNIST